MSRARSGELVPLDPEIERTLRRIKKENQEVPVETNTMAECADTRALRDYATPSANGFEMSIRNPTIQANNFEIKLGTIQMIHNSVEFRGLPNDDPNDHLVSFLEICDTFKYNGVTEDAIKL